MNPIEMMHWTFISQILVISVLMPLMVISQIKHTLNKYPANLHPELYPVSPEQIMKQGRQFQVMNALIAALGLWLVVATKQNAHTEFLNWDSQSVIMLFFLLQYTPYVWLSYINKSFNEKLRELNKKHIVTASLKPRKLTHYITPGEWMGVALIWSVFGAVVLYVYFFHPFDGFAGLWNLLVIVFINAFYGLLSHQFISRNKPAPHQDREQVNRTFCRAMVMVNIMSGVYLTWSMSMHLLDLRAYSDVFQTLYLQAIAVMTYWLFTHHTPLSSDTPTDHSNRIGA